MLKDLRYLFVSLLSCDSIQAQDFPPNMYTVKSDKIVITTSNPGVSSVVVSFAASFCSPFIFNTHTS